MFSGGKRETGAGGGVGRGWQGEEEKGKVLSTERINAPSAGRRLTIPFGTRSL